jgi:hypothetical protein
MGYRSEVAFEIKSHDKSQLEFLRRQFRPLFECSDIAEEEDIIKNDDNSFSLTFYNDWLKWYPDYPEVQMFDKMWELAEKWELMGAFVCLGEDSNDSEVDYINKGWNLSLGYQRIIVKDW